VPARSLTLLRAALFAAIPLVGVPVFLLSRRNAAGANDGAGELPRYGSVPAFSLPAASGAPLDVESLRGSVWVADFIFTRCLEVCPLMTTRMKALERDLRGLPGGDAVRLVSFSVDPEHDTPEVLAEYAAKWQASPPHWTFVSGSSKEVERIVVTGFKLAVQKKPVAGATTAKGTSAGGEGSVPVDIVHANRFVLVDRTLTIRGYYDSEALPDMQALARDAARLAR
jgi:protein SCO1/2